MFQRFYLTKKMPADKVAATNWKILQHHASQLRLGDLDQIELELIDENSQVRLVGLHTKHLDISGMSAEMRQIRRFVFLI